MSIGVTDEIAPLGSFPVVDDTNVKGGYRPVADVTARDAILANNRKAGMLVRTESTGEIWTLAAGLTNGDWSLAGAAVVVKDEGIVLATAGAFDFVGAGVTVTTLGNIATVTVPGALGGTGVSYQPMAIDEGTDIRNAEIVIGGLYFDPTAFTAPTVTFRLTGNYSSVDIAGNAQIRLYDMGPASGAFSPVRRATLTIPYVSVGDQVKLDQVLSLVGGPGVNANQIHTTARVYEVRMYLNTADVGSEVNVAWAGFEVVGGSLGSSNLIIKDEGTTLTAAATSINFVGSGANTTNLGGAVTVTVSGIPSGIDATVTTNNATPTLIYQYVPTGAGRVISFNVEILAGKTGVRAYYALLSFWSTKADGTPVLHNTTYLNGPYEEDVAWMVTLVPSGMAIDVKVTGAALTTIDWRIIGAVNEHSMAGGGDP